MSDGTRRRMKIASQRALRAWGREAQIRKAAEEAVELANALMHYKDDPDTDQHYARLGDVIDEIADCEIMLTQLRLLFNIGGLIVAVGACIFIMAMVFALSREKHSDDGYYVKPKEPKK